MSRMFSLTQLTALVFESNAVYPNLSQAFDTIIGKEMIILHILLWIGEVLHLHLSLQVSSIMHGNMLACRKRDQIQVSE